MSDEKLNRGDDVFLMMVAHALGGLATQYKGFSQENPFENHDIGKMAVELAVGTMLAIREHDDMHESFKEMEPIFEKVWGKDAAEG